MDISREELLKQKAMLEEQLKWVNHKLGDTTPAENTPVPDESTGATPLANPTAEEPLPDPGTQFAEAAQQFNTLPDEAAKKAAADQELEKLVGKRTSSGGKLRNSEKLGCAVIAIALIGGALFVLFVLPHLIY